MASFAPEVFGELQRLFAEGGGRFDCVPALPLDDYTRVSDRREVVAGLKRLPFGSGRGVHFVAVYANRWTFCLKYSEYLV